MNVIYPMAVMVFHTILVSIMMLVVRVRDVKSGNTDPKFFKTYQDGGSRKVILWGRHYANLFEMPILFYAGILTALHLHLSSSVLLCAAWIFVLSRVFHSYFHLSKNKLIPRMSSFLIGVLAIIFMWIEIVRFA